MCPNCSHSFHKYLLVINTTTKPTQIQKPKLLAKCHYLYQVKNPRFAIMYETILSGVQEGAENTALFCYSTISTWIAQIKYSHALVVGHFFF